MDGVGPGEHRIFITSALYNGNLGGLAGADALCQGLAFQAGLSKTYKAVLGSQTVAAKDRLSLLGAVYLFSGPNSKTKVFELGTDLWSAFPANAINIDQNFSAVSSGAWTGSESGGANDTIEDCSGWSNSATSIDGSVGDPSQPNDLWLEDPPDSACDASHHLYCISQ